MTYYPDPERYQQLGNGDPYGYADCTAWSAAYCVDADREGTFRTTGTAVRKHSDEPIPDRRSPGLNLPQADASVIEITKGKVDLDVHTGMDIDRAEWLIKSGRYAMVQVNRSVLVHAGYGGANDFTGGHCEATSWRGGEPSLFDPLIKHTQRMNGFGVLWRAAGALVTGVGGSVVGYGRANVAFTRDVTPDWVAAVPAETTFTRLILDATGRNVIGRRRPTTKGGFSALCSGPFYVRSKSGPIKVVKLTSGRHAGWVIRSKWARQVN
jgi:hypothetical protein